MDWKTLFEVGMVLCFGAAWPASIVRSYRARTARGKSLAFLAIIELGYVAGILSKLLGGSVTYVLFFYVLNFLMVLADILLYFRNRSLDRKRAAEEKNFVI